MEKIAIVGVHSTGKSKICEKVYDSFTKDFINEKQFTDFEGKFELIPEQFRKVVKDLNLPKSDILKQTEEITLATYAKQLYLENLYTAQGKNILCDRSVLDTFVYYNYFRGCCYYDKFLIKEDNLNKKPICERNYKTLQFVIGYTENTYSKIYLIEPSDRPIEDDGFRLTDKEQQLEIHKLFLEYFKDFSNVEIVNQEEAHKEEFVQKVVDKFILDN